MGKYWWQCCGCGHYAMHSLIAECHTCAHYRCQDCFVWTMKPDVKPSSDDKNAQTNVRERGSRKHLDIYQDQSERLGTENDNGNEKDWDFHTESWRDDTARILELEDIPTGPVLTPTVSDKSSNLDKGDATLGTFYHDDQHRTQHTTYQPYSQPNVDFESNRPADEREKANTESLRPVETQDFEQGAKEATKNQTHGLEDRQRQTKGLHREGTLSKYERRAYIERGEPSDTTFKPGKTSAHYDSVTSSGGQVLAVFQPDSANTIHAEPEKSSSNEENLLKHLGNEGDPRITQTVGSILEYPSDYEQTSLRRVHLYCFDCGNYVSDKFGSLSDEQGEEDRLESPAGKVLCQVCGRDKKASKLESGSESGSAEVAPAAAGDLLKDIKKWDISVDRNTMGAITVETRKALRRESLILHPNQAPDKPSSKDKTQTSQSLQQSTSSPEGDRNGSEHLRGKEVDEAALESGSDESNTSDVESIMSIPVSIASSASSVGDLPNSAILSLACMLLKDEDLKSLINEAVLNIGPARFQRNLKRLLVQYGYALRKEVTSHLEGEVARFVRLSSTRVSIEVKDRVLKVSSKHPDKETLNEYLKSHDVESDHAGSSDEEDDEGGNFCSLQNLERVEGFLLSGQAFIDFRTDLEDWIRKALNIPDTIKILQGNIDAQLPATTSEVPGPYKCLHCGKTFHDIDDQMSHVLDHNNENLHICHLPECKIEFSSALELYRHSRTHADPESRGKEWQERLQKKDGSAGEATVTEETHPGNDSRDPEHEAVLQLRKAIHNSYSLVKISIRETSTGKSSFETLVDLLPERLNESQASLQRLKAIVEGKATDSNTANETLSDDLALAIKQRDKYKKKYERYKRKYKQGNEHHNGRKDERINTDVRMPHHNMPTPEYNEKANAGNHSAPRATSTRHFEETQSSARANIPEKKYYKIKRKRIKYVGKRDSSQSFDDRGSTLIDTNNSDVRESYEHSLPTGPLSLAATAPSASSSLPAKQRGRSSSSDHHGTSMNECKPRDRSASSKPHSGSLSKSEAAEHVDSQEATATTDSESASAALTLPTRSLAERLKAFFTDLSIDLFDLNFTGVVHILFLLSEPPREPGNKDLWLNLLSLIISCFDWTKFIRLAVQIIAILLTSELIKHQLKNSNKPSVSFEGAVGLAIAAYYMRKDVIKSTVPRAAALIPLAFVASVTQMQYFDLNIPWSPETFIDSNRFKMVSEIISSKLPTASLFAASSSILPWRKPLWNIFSDWMQPTPRDGYGRVSWTCRCGKRLHMQVPRECQAKAMEFAQKAAGANNVDSISLSNFEGSCPPLSSASSVSSSPDSAGMSSSTDSGTAITEPSIEGSQDGYNPFIPAGTKKYMLLCVNSARRLIRLSNVDVTDLDDDEDVFAKMRESYKMLRGRRARNPFMRPTTMHYVEFRLLHLQKSFDCVGSYQTNRIPSTKEVMKGEYAFNPCPPEHSDVPIDPDVFMHVFSTPGDHLGGMAAEMLPKKLHSRLLWDKNVNGATYLPRGWGFYIVEGVDWAFVRWCVLGLVLGVTILTVVWSAVTRDVQGGTGIGQYCIGALAMLSTVLLFSGGLVETR